MFSLLYFTQPATIRKRAIKESAMTDFTFSPTDFASTEITVVANTQDAKEYLAERYGFGCVSINIRKSAAPEFADSFEFQGLSYQ
jgi:hypothetical protein